MKVPVYHIQIEFTSEVAGACPVSRNLIGDYIEAVRAGTGNVLLAAIKQQGIVDDAAIEKFLEKATGLHYRDAKGAYIPGVNLIANMMQTAKALKITGTSIGSAFYTALTMGVFIPDRLYITPDNSEFVSRATQPIQRGHRTPSLANYEMIKRGSVVDFDMGVLDSTELPKERIKTMLQLGGLGQHGGLGGLRTLGFGKFRLADFRNGKTMNLDTGKAKKDEDVLEEEEIEVPAYERELVLA